MAIEVEAVGESMALDMVCCSWMRELMGRARGLLEER